MNAFDWPTVEARLVARSGSNEYSDTSIKVTARRMVHEYHTKKQAPLDHLRRECKAMLEKTDAMTWTHPLATVEAFETFLTTAIDVIDKLKEDEGKLQAILEEFEILPSATDIKSMERDWAVVTTDDLEEFEVVEHPGCKAILEEFEIIPSTNEMRMEADWDVMTVDDIDNFEVIETR
ncbi:hypothetical protein B0T21DRAFT_414555 [Apiosordaria backusii]|uniref:Uncharacterized protein n=1 Tax=Apiosordaria backusii TaxID=314023 RepID=A0AA40ASU5_9PEZI|nr:hypothetical protein B0T21DRAFT_414555 [Apiosordaria backusii]